MKAYRDKSLRNERIRSEQAGSHVEEAVALLREDLPLLASDQKAKSEAESKTTTASTSISLTTNFRLIFTRVATTQTREGQNA